MKTSRYLIPLLSLLTGCVPVSFFALTSGVAGAAGYSEIAERVTDKERELIINRAAEVLKA